jgi:hypothetical protein
MMARHLVVISPFCVALGLLPAEWWIRLSVVALALVASSFVVLVGAGELRAARLHQHGLRAPGDRDDQ